MKSKHTFGIILCSVIALLALVAEFIPLFVVTKARDVDLTERASLVLNSAPEAKAREHAYIFTEAGTGYRYMVYSDSVLEQELFNGLKQGDEITYRTYKDDSVGVKTIADLGAVRIIVSLEIGEAKVVTISSYNDALSNDLMWLQIACGVTAGVFLILDGVLLYLRGRNKARR